MSIDRFNTLTQDLADIQNAEKIERAHLAMVASGQGDRKSYNALVKGWKAKIRKPQVENVVAAVQAVASDLNKRGRKGT